MMSDFKIINGVLEKYSGSGGNVVIPDGVRSIGDYAFESCDSLTNVEIPGSVTSIGLRAFRGCSSLTSVVIPDGVRSIGYHVFSECSSLTSVKISDSVTSIGEGAFYGCNSLTSVVIPDGVRSIKMNAFRECSSLTSVRIPDGVRSIGEWAFENCSSLTSVRIPDSVTSIGLRAFYGCSSLTEIVARPRICTPEREVFFSVPFRGQTKFTVRIYPKLSLTIIKEPEIKRELALGYCLTPEKYEEPWAGEYQVYVKSQCKKLLERAKKMNLPEAIRFLEQVEAFVNGEKETKGEKLSPQAKVELLEKIVRENEPDELRAVIDREGPFEFTARALGYACAFGGMETVEILLEAGADFTYELDNAFKRKYKVTQQVSNRYEQLFCYWMNMARGDLCKKQQEDVCRYLGGGSETQLLPERERTRIALDLLKRNTPGFDAEELLYYAILWGSFKLADELQNVDVRLSRERCAILSELDLNNYARRNRMEWEDAVMNMAAADSIKVLTRLLDLLDEQGKKLVISKSEMEQWVENAKCFDGNILRLMVERADVSRVSEKDLMMDFIDHERADFLAVCEQSGWIKGPAQRDKLIDYAMKKNKKQALAWLLDYKNRTADFAAEEEKREKKRMRQLSETSDSASALRKIWSWKKREDGTLCLTSYKGTETEVAIPEKIGNKIVTALEGTFNENKRFSQVIKSVTIPDSVTSIDGAFRGCRGLTNVVIPNSASIGYRAFKDCESLINVTIPDSMTIPAGVTSIKKIEEEAFYGCRSLTNVTIPVGVTSIGKSAFCSCSSLKSVTIPAGVTSIGKGAFYWCHSLTNVTFSVGMTSIEEDAFFSCSSLARVEIPDSVASIGENAFCWCHSLTNVTLSAGMTSIGRGVFCNCDSLTNVTIPASVTSIGESAFFGCSSLAKVEIPASVMSIEEGAFDNCSSLTIYAPAGSYAEQYAKRKHILFETL